MTVLAHSQSRGVLTGRHVLVLIVGFFGIVFAVNAYFIHVALSTHTGVVAHEPYRKGLKYNERIAAAEQQARVGWQDEIALSPDGRRLSIVVFDSAGLPVRGLAMTATLGRPATILADMILTPLEGAPGRYEAATGLGQPGAYIASIEVRASAGRGDVVYRARKRLWLSP